MLNNGTIVSREFAADLDLHEAAGWNDYCAKASPEVLQQCGLRLEKIAGAYATIACNIDMVAVDRVIGLGLVEPACESHLDRIISLYRETGVRQFFVQVSPHARPAAILDWLKVWGFGRCLGIWHNSTANQTLPQKHNVADL